MRTIERRLSAVETRIPPPTEPAPWDLSRWTDDEGDEACVISAKIKAAQDANPDLHGEAVIHSALTPDEMERAAVLVGIATGDRPPAHPVPASWPNGWAP